MEIKAADVKALREATGAGMMECKKALVECNGDAEAAAKLLKEKGLAAMAKRSERATTEGRLFVRQNGNKIAVIELTCETDFVANNVDFVAVGEKLLDITFEKGYTKVEAEHEQFLEPLKVSIRENMKVAKVEVIDVPADAAASFYVHSDMKTGAVVVVKGSTADAVKAFAYDCCLHIAAFTPAYTAKKDVPATYIAEQKEIFKAQMDQDPKMASKPDNVKDGILQGKINKHLAEICFEDQMFVKDDKKTVTAKLAEVGKEVGASLSFATAKLFVLGK
ncbi:MAG: translation elongation factor Ts [Spirochaetaceae bacterium]|nr:translation elongation factor Ts [Spirochaetaceae bacterium]